MSVLFISSPSPQLAFKGGGTWRHQISNFLQEKACLTTHFYDFITRMGPRRGNTLPQTDSLAPNGSLAQPRATSPSSGFTQFLTKPSKWFSRSVSASKAPPTISEPRLSVSSTRKHKISHPTDPRPILDAYAGSGSR